VTMRATRKNKKHLSLPLKTQKRSRKLISTPLFLIELNS
jgi:hypothetical protein